MAIGSEGGELIYNGVELATDLGLLRRKDPLAQEYFRTGNKDAVWDMLFDRVAEKIGGEYQAHRK